jgi:hypothetical protein
VGRQGDQGRRKTLTLPLGVITAEEIFMKILLSNEPIPHDFSGHPELSGCVHQDDISIGSSRLKLKLLVFHKPKHLRHFWKKGLGKPDLGKRCFGAVNSMGYELFRNGKPYAHVYDPRYFAIMGLCVDHLGMEILTHEAVHAGIAYAKRTKTRNLWHDPMDLDEESIAYPVGRIARNVLLSLRKVKLLA